MGMPFAWQESGLIAAGSRIDPTQNYRSIVRGFVGYGKIGTWRHDLGVDDLFPLLAARALE